MTIRHTISRAATTGLGAWVALLFALPATAAQPEDCPTWFPDFRCDRQGRYEGFVPPMIQPYLFEDPFITTGLNAVYIWHDFPGSSVFEGGDANIYALQARLAITDRIAFIATKDGYVDFGPDLGVLDKSNGWADIAFGFKGSLVDRPDIPFILTPAVRFEMTQGSASVFQGNGDGNILLSTSAAWSPAQFDIEELKNLHLIGNVGFTIPFDNDDESTHMSWHMHVDYALHKYFVPFMELSGIVYLDSGDGTYSVRLKGGGSAPLKAIRTNFEGNDYANLGNKEVQGNHMMSWAAGVRIPVHRHLILGAAYERPVGDRRDILRQRVTVQATVEF
ncbi:MAG: hypothetical protein QNK03_22935 [Myxococcota bacterium]|nr:hypothetical protein [Myxococcota bacterium]